ncbi:SGNH/GDSL hydrolase family protein [bacterium]|nr:SGNH/GDSL hydrolase family protein [bacterium]
MSFKVIIGFGIGVYIAFIAISLFVAKQWGNEIARNTAPFLREKGSISLLVLGDSTAYGVGASAPDKSVPGRLADFLNGSVENYARSGALTREIRDQFLQSQRSRYDLVLIQVGANDVMFGKSLESAARSLQETIRLVHSKSERVLVLTAGDIGLAEIFPWPLSTIFSYRTRILREAFKRVCVEEKAVYVDIYAQPDIFGTAPHKYYAKDGLHLLDSGYEYWFDIVRGYVEKNWPELTTTARVH